MKTLPVLITILSMGISSAWASSPIPHHPYQPSVDIMQAIEIATEYLNISDGESVYCTYAALKEKSMIPAPRGSARHWEIHFVKGGDERSIVQRIYVSMTGEASKTVPSR